ncbi:hypothetical protein SPRG_08176 [Saprolegnia parasitica CBS 223.65]|uniref:FYVE-type domain-containing protein n=1 Tax=Saprolegnia parasitica (strain CBS 223.65) TaxID=695850 RepID=A0A067C792_SAPPC|nr:hypothetical protein SPRG_08176 [Saprolegnia parasitica CBS 223.65]KDO26373.1 hypothetical protein SPRG_08176 [Saprolegnia parasitica CBS 223.65]|eukprot:XP_012202811.1 hypothetical protein SPRG_08176 [Saprolegnia parasitica CBS 223.65]
MAAPKKSEAIRLAESCKWAELRALVERDPAAAQDRDRYGMIPLHWACTDSHTPQELLMLLLKAYPQGARVFNSGKMLPLHIAIKAQANVEWLQALLANYPEAVLVKTPVNEDVLSLAKKSRLPPRTLHLLEEMRDHVQKMHGSRESFPERLGSQSSEPGDDNVLDDDHAMPRKYSNGLQRPASHSAPAFRNTPSSSYGSQRSYNDSLSENHMPLNMQIPMEVEEQPYLLDPQARRYSNRLVVSLPPRWQNAPNCHICSCKFGTFKKRHHCRNCGQSICTDHSAKQKLKLPHFGLTSRQRVCVLCHDALTRVEAPILDTHVIAHGAPLYSQRAHLPGTMQRTQSTGSMSGSSSRGFVPPPPPPPHRTYSASSSRSDDMSPHMYPPSNYSDKDTMLEDMNMQVMLLQQQVSKLMEEKQQAEALLLRHTSLSESASARNTEDSSFSRAQDLGLSITRDPSMLGLTPQPVTTPPPVSPVAAHVEPPLSTTYSDTSETYTYDIRETSLTDHDTRDTYFEFRDTAYSLDDRETFVAKYLKPTTPVANLANISESPESSAVKFDDNEEEAAAADEADDEDTMSVHDLVDDDIPRDIQEVDTLVTLGIAMLQKGSASGAVAAFERAVELLPRDPLLYSYLGKAYYADEDLDRAVLALERSLDLVPSAANSTLLGKILFEKGDHDKAILAYQRSLEIQRGN